MIFEAATYALFYRIRGGFGNEFVRKFLKRPEGWEIPNGIIRGLFALIVTLFTCYDSGMWYVSPIIFASVFAVVCYGYLGKFNLGDPANRNLKNYALLTIDGMKIMALLALFMGIFGHYELWFKVAAGAVFVPAYLIGYKINQRTGSTYGEWILGAALGAL